eukprot:6742034-Prymnesium_polylepis.1
MPAAGPVIVASRSRAPGCWSAIDTLHPDWSRIDLMLTPPLPMIVPESLDWKSSRNAKLGLAPSRATSSMSSPERFKAIAIALRTPTTH